jgi:uncharacterized protein YdaU (DUF1376 family)
MAKAPAFQFYPKDYLADPNVRLMTHEERGLYWDAICMCWLQGSLSNDPVILSKLFGISLRKFSRIWPKVAVCFQENDGKLSHKRLDAERTAQKENRDRRKDAARKRWEKEQLADAIHMQEKVSDQSAAYAMQCSPSPSPSASPTPSPTAVSGAYAAPLISGVSSPAGWAKVHNNHVPEFCDWVCLPDFIFAELCAKSGQEDGSAYVTAWARKVRQDWQGKPIGDDGLKFWRWRWQDTHKVNAKRNDFEEAKRKLAAKYGEGA